MRRHAATLAAAAAVHVALFAAIHVAPAPARPATPAPSDTAGDTTFDVEEIAAQPQPQSQSPSPSPSPAPLAAAAELEPAAAATRATPAREARGDAAQQPPGASTESASPPAVLLPPGEPAGGGWSMPPGHVDLGIAGMGGPRALGATPLTIAEASRPRENRASAGRVAEGLDALDVARGLGRGGPVATAIEEVARRVPALGVVTFDVEVMRDGHVHVVVADASAERAEWERLAPEIAVHVQSKPIRFPESVRGLRVLVRLDAREQLPDGSDPKKLGTFAKTHGLKIVETKNGVKFESVPGVTIGVRGKVCSAGLHIGLDGPSIGGGCSPENAGTVPVRVVAAKVLRETRI